MAVLPDADRIAVWADAMRRMSDERQTVAITKDDLRAAVDALDTFLNTNAATINAAIPQPARANLTTPQKALLLMFVISRRYLSGVYPWRLVLFSHPTRRNFPRQTIRRSP